MMSERKILFLNWNAYEYEYVYRDFTRIRERKASTRILFVHRKDVVTDLEKCCMMIQLIQLLHSQARRAPGCFHS